MKDVKLGKTIAASAVAMALMSGSALAETVTLAAYAGIFEDHYKRAVIEPFMAAHPDITIEYYAMPNSAQTLGTLRAQKASPQIDVAVMDVSVAKAATDEGLFAPMDASAVPNYADLYPQAQPAGVNAAGVTFDNLVMLYNTEVIPETPTSWEELWNTDHAGRVAVPAVPDIQGTTLTIIANKMAGGENYLESVDAGIEKLGELAPNVQTWDPKPDSYQVITSGQADIGIGWNARAQVYSADSEGRLGVALPEEGSGFQINVMALVEGAPHPDAAATFIDYALSPDAQAAFTEEMFYAPTNSKAAAQISEAALAKTAANSMDQMMDIDWLEVAKIRDDITEKWRRGVIPLSR